jgi:restriction system protein
MPSANDVPKYNELMWPTLSVLKDIGGSMTNREIEAAVADWMQLSEEITSVMHNNRETKFAYRLAWARTHLKFIGAVTNSERGVWSITDLGEGLNQEETIKLHDQYREELKEKRRKQKRNRALSDDDQDIDNDENDWKSQLLDLLKKMDPSAFERLTRRLLLESGFIKVQVLGKTGDGGIDGQGILKMNLISFQVFFQCKRYSGTVGSGDVRDFRGAMQGRGDKGLFVTTGIFSSSARQEATRDGAPAIDLIDGDDLCDLLKELKLGVTTEMVEQVTISNNYFDSI